MQKDNFNLSEFKFNKSFNSVEGCNGLKISVHGMW